MFLVLVNYINLLLNGSQHCKFDNYSGNHLLGKPGHIWFFLCVPMLVFLQALGNRFLLTASELFPNHQAMSYTCVY